MSDQKKSSIQSIDRACAILKCFDRGVRLGLMDICSQVGLHKSTAYGILNALAANGLLTKDSDGKYQLGIELCRLAANVDQDIRSLGLPHLRQLLAKTGETVNLVIPDDTHVIYIEKLESPQAMRICTYIGMRVPMYCTAVGKAILAFLPEEEASDILDRSMLVKKTEHTITSKEALLRQLAEIREAGYALDREELEYGLVCVAVPILSSGGSPIAAFSCSGPAQRMTGNIIAALAHDLMLHAKALSGMCN